MSNRMTTRRRISWIERVIVRWVFWHLQYRRLHLWRCLGLPEPCRNDADYYLARHTDGRLWFNRPRWPW